MSVTVDLPAEELAQIRQLTHLNDDAQAVARAAKEFLRLSLLRQLKAVSGKVDFEDNWRELEAAEIAELRQPGFPK